MLPFLAFLGNLVYNIIIRKPSIGFGKYGEMDMDADMDAIETKEEEAGTFHGIFDALRIVSGGACIFLVDFATGRFLASEHILLELNLKQNIYEDYREGLEALESLVHPEDLDFYRLGMKSLLEGGANAHDVEARMKNVEGEYVVVTIHGALIHSGGGHRRYLACSMTNHKGKSYIDSLTGFRNQYGFFYDIENRLRQHQHARVWLAGIQRLSEYNNLYGYAFGNRLIQSFGHILKDFLKGRGTVYRMDGATFAVVMPSLSEQEIRRGYQEIHERVKAGVWIDGHKMPFALKSSMLTLGDGIMNGKAVYSCLLYAYGLSKQRYFGNLVSYEEVAGQSGANSLAKISKVREAIVEDCRGFYLCYQPVVDCTTERLTGAEALIRWRGEPYGTVMPNDFIPVLEKDSAYQKLGHWILRRAMLDGKELLKIHPHFVMNVNLSYSQMENPDFLEDLKSILKETAYPPKNLCLELTERCRLLEVDRLRHLVTEIRAMGIQVAVDDFGTGYSSLSILKAMPVDCVKIDRSFVMNLLEDASCQNFVHRLTDFLSICSDKTCVEGIESPGMRTFLLGCSVSSLQGYYYSPPVEFSEFAKYAAKMA